MVSQCFPGHLPPPSFPRYLFTSYLLFSYISSTLRSPYLQLHKVSTRLIWSFLFTPTDPDVKVLEPIAVTGLGSGLLATCGRQPMEDVPPGTQTLPKFTTVMYSLVFCPLGWTLYCWRGLLIWSWQFWPTMASLLITSSSFCTTSPICLQKPLFCIKSVHADVLAIVFF